MSMSQSAIEDDATEFAVPVGFTFAEICLRPKAQPTCRVSAHHKCQSAGKNCRNLHQTHNHQHSSLLSSPIEYHLLHTGLFVRIATMPGRLYWMAQNSDCHRTPDWKLHVAIHPEWIPRAWDEILLPVFLSFPSIARIGAKAVLEAERVTYSTKDSIGAPGDFVTTTDSSFWAPEQYGRELTVYLFQDDPVYNEFFGNIGAAPAAVVPGPSRRRNLWEGDNPDLVDHWQQLTPDMSFSGKQLIRFVTELQRRLDALEVANPGVRISRGDTAEGDLKLTRSVSLRNEAYATSHPSEVAVEEEDSATSIGGPELQYPLNEWGWNAACHALPPSIRSCIAHFRGRSDAELSDAEHWLRMKKRRQALRVPEVATSSQAPLKAHHPKRVFDVSSSLTLAAVFFAAAIVIPLAPTISRAVGAN